MQFVIRSHRQQSRLFFSFDGVDGVGKSTQMRAFCQWLTARGHEVTECRDPGSTAVGESVRELLLHGQDLAISLRTEMLLYMASRAQLVSEVVEPALEAGQVVVCDRYLLANVVYQGHAGGLPPELIWQVGAIATSSVQPDQTFLLDMPANRATVRRGRDPDRMEARGLDYLERVRQGFLLEASRNPGAISVVNADQTVEEVQDAIRKIAEPLL